MVRSHQGKTIRLRFVGNKSGGTLKPVAPEKEEPGPFCSATATHWSFTLAMICMRGGSWTGRPVGVAVWLRSGCDWRARFRCNAGANQSLSSHSR